MDFLLEAITALTLKHVAMWAIGGLLIYLAIVKDMKPSTTRRLSVLSVRRVFPFSLWRHAW